MNRREFLWVAAMLSAGVSTAAKGMNMTSEQRQFLASKADYIERSIQSYFSDVERNTVAAAAEIIIPRTDTPGAKEAGVPRFIELMVGDWFNAIEKNAFMLGLNKLIDSSGGNFTGLSSEDQLNILEDLEEAASESAWYIAGNTMRLWDATAPFICQLKELTVLGFMLSSVGANQFLTPNPMGYFDGDVPLRDVGSAYAAEKPIRTLFGK